MSIFNQARDLFARTKRANELSPFTVGHDAFDQYVLDDIREAAPKFNAAMAQPFETTDAEGNATPFNGSTDLKSDLFFAHHASGDSVNVLPSEQLKPSRELARQVMQAYGENENFLKTRPYTQADGESSAIATRAAERELEKALSEQAMEEHVKRAEEMEQREDAMDAAERILENLRTQAAEAKENGDPLPVELTDEIAQTSADKRQAQAELAELVQAHEASGARGAAETAVAKASEAAKDAAQIWTSLPGNESGNHSNLSPDEAIALAEKWVDNPQMAELSKLLGRFVRDFRGKAAKRVKGGRDERVGIETGRDLSRVLASELVHLTHPTLKRKFFKGFAEHSLLQHEMVGVHEASRGPMIACLDLSGSMRSADKHVQAKAVVLALVAQAHRDRRSAGVVAFDTEIMGSWFFPGRGAVDLRDLTAIAEMSPAGGTDITVAMLEGERLIARVTEFSKADIVLITDGSDYYEPDDEIVRDRLRALGVRIHGVNIGPAVTPYQERMCDDYTAVADLAEPNEATDALVASIVA